MAIPDPAPNVSKSLSVTYTFSSGSPKTVTIREGGNLRLP